MKKKEKNDNEIILQTKKLVKEYGSGRTRFKALNNINLEVKSGEFVSIMGPSGSGKTTLLNMLGALDRPTSGDVSVNGINTAKVPEHKLYKVRRNHVGFIFQNYYLVPTLSALENVLMPALPLGITKDVEKRAKSLLKRVGLSKRSHHKPGELSGGEQQRVAIARSLILDPPLILADEPTGNLDTKTGIEVFRLMQELNKEKGVTFVIVTHDPRIAKQTQRTLYLKDGKLSKKPTIDESLSF